MCRMDSSLNPGDAKSKMTQVPKQPEVTAVSQSSWAVTRQEGWNLPSFLAGLTGAYATELIRSEDPRDSLTRSLVHQS